MRRREFLDKGICLLAMASVPSLAYGKEKEKVMILKKAKVPPLNTTMMGLIKGVSDYYGLGWSDAMIFGGSGHGFMINIHETLCPSSPYCWKRENFYSMLPNIGIEMKDEGFFSEKNSATERGTIEGILKKALDAGEPCGLVNMEFQLISGYDETGFITSQPWAPHMMFPPGHLAFGSWAEFGNEIHVNFFTFKKVKPLSEKEIVIKSLKHAQDIYKNPDMHTSKPYATGAAAFDAWIKAVEAGHGKEHGGWWNGTVWAECRSFVSAYFAEISKKFPSIADKAKGLCVDYRLISDKLSKASDKELGAEPKVALLREAKDLELACIKGLGDVLAQIG